MEFQEIPIKPHNPKAGKIPLRSPIRIDLLQAKSGTEWHVYGTRARDRLRMAAWHLGIPIMTKSDGKGTSRYVVIKLGDAMTKDQFLIIQDNTRPARRTDGIYPTPKTGPSYEAVSHVVPPSPIDVPLPPELDTDAQT